MRLQQVRAVFPAPGRWLSVVAAAIVGLTGGLVMMGWLFEIDSVKNVFADLATMKFNTALCFVLSGIAVGGLQDPSRVRLAALGRGAAAMVLAVAGLSLVEYALAVDVGIDQLVVADTGNTTGPPGRMSIGTAATLIGLALALLLLDTGPRRPVTIAQVLALCVLVTGGAALIAYLYGVRSFRFAILSSMALHTAFLLVLAALAVLYARPDRGVMTLASGSTPGSRSVRLVVPGVVLVCVSLGWLSVTAVDSGVIEAHLAFALNSVASIAILAVFAWTSAHAIDRSERYFRETVNSAPVAMIVIDASGMILLANAQAVQMFGYESVPLIGREIEDLLPAPLRTQHRSLRRAFFETPEARAMGRGRDLYGLRRDGGRFAVEIGLSPIRTVEGALVLATVADITERKQAEAALRARTDELARSNQDLEQFAYAASHDLQEPLRAVGGYVQLLARRYRGQLDERADQFIDFAVDGAQRMQRLIDDLLLYSRVGRAEIPTEPADLNDVLESALKNLARAIDESGAAIERERLPVIRGVASQLTLLFQNLVGNGLKFRRPGVPVRIRVAARHADPDWIVSVADNGIGIDSQHFDRIFAIFQRLHTRDEYPGTGIGLALCKRITEHHGGRMWVESMVAAGTTMYVTFPYYNDLTSPGSMRAARQSPAPNVFR